MIKIDFEKTDGVYIYRDALWLPEDHTYTEAELEAMKQQRFDRWIAVITAPPPLDQPEDTTLPPTEGI